jgi:hypothetical protein
MVEERQVYVSFENPDYKSNKAELLRCKANLINIQKCLHNIQAMRSNKKRLIAHLYKLVSSSEFIVERLQEKMPDPTLPKGLKFNSNKKTKIADKEPKIKIKKEKNDEDDFSISNLDKELLELNQKIKELGG